jgi:hypothetical protein
LLLVLDIVLAFALVSWDHDPGAILLHDLYRYLFGLVNLAVASMAGRQLKKQHSLLRELRIEARLRIQRRDDPDKR